MRLARNTIRNSSAAIFILAATAILFASAALVPSGARTDEPAYDTVGAIDGETISVQGPMNVEVVNGHTRTILRSGSDIRVNSGRARIDLVEGGEISICGPAHFSVLKSVNLLTIALDSGVIHARIEDFRPVLTVYTAQLQAKPFAISEAAQDALVGFDQTGAMCIRADSGAVRVEQQLTAQSIVIPQNAEVLIPNGQLDGLRSGVTHCSCELQLAKTPAPSLEISRLATDEEIAKSKAEPKRRGETAKGEIPKASAKEEPVYQVFMPPLSYDAKAKEQHDNFDPQLIVLVRRVRVRPTLIFHGTVKDAPVSEKAVEPSATTKPETPAPQIQQAPPKNPSANKSAMERARAYLRKLFS